MSTQAQNKSQGDTDSINTQSLAAAIEVKDAQTQPFRFLDLPKDIRRMVYDLLPEQRSRSFRIAQSDVGHMDFKPQTALLQTCKAIHDEAKPSLEAQRSLTLRKQKCVITVVWPQPRTRAMPEQTFLVFNSLTRALSLAHLSDIVAMEMPGNNELPSSVHAATMLDEINSFQLSFTSDWKNFLPEISPPNADTYVTDEFKAWFEMMLLQLRHSTEIERRTYARGNAKPASLIQEVFSHGVVHPSLSPQVIASQQ